MEENNSLLNTPNVPDINNTPNTPNTPNVPDINKGNATPPESQKVDLTDQSKEGLALGQEALLAGKYKTTKDLENGYKEQSKFINQLKTKAEENNSNAKVPEEYKFDFSKVEGLKDVALDMEDPMFKSMLPVFKEAGLSQEQADQVVTGYLKDLQNMAPNEEEETKKLGANGEVIITKMSEYCAKLSEKDQEILSALTDTAEGTEFLYRMLINPEQGIPEEGSNLPLESGQELIDKALKFKKDHEATIGSVPSQQKIYNELYQQGLGLKAQGK